MSLDRDIIHRTEIVKNKHYYNDFNEVHMQNKNELKYYRTERKQNTTKIYSILLLKG